MKTRLFIGNLPSTVTEAELKEKFCSLFSSHAGEAEVGSVEIRCKNEDNFFGYVDVHLNQSDNGSSGAGGANGLPAFIRKDIDRLNNTKWKGSLIKVQVAKESFIDKLKREQLENRKNGWNQAPVQKEVAEKDNSEKGRNKRHANDVLNQLNKFTDRKNKSNKFQDQNANHHGNKANGNCGFEIVSSESAVPKSPPKATTSSPPKQKKQKKRSKKDETSSSEDDSDDDVRDGIPKFKGLLMCYPDGLPDPKMDIQPEEKKEEEKTIIQSEEEEDDDDEEEKPSVISTMRKKLLALAFEEEARKKSPVKLQKPTPTPTSPQTKPGIIFKKSKQQKSDLLRLQSMEKMKELKAQQNNLIKSSLSSVAASAPVTEQRKLLESDEEDDHELGEDGKAPKKKKAKMTLFDDDDDEDEVDNMENGENDGDLFKVKKQFEGASGQKLLELQTRFANDDRFKIDDRFKESDAEEDEVEAVEQEKEKQLDILTGILGKVVTSTRPPSGQKKGSATKESFSSVIMPRYDPEADDSNENEKMEVDDEKSSKKTAKEKSGKTESEESKEKVIRSTEPATFKTVSNLKALFSSTEGDNEAGKDNAPVSALFSKPLTTVATQPQSSFSLLATFGKNEEEDDIKADKKARTKSSESTAEGPRTFWQSNPFRYDSSDDEEDDARRVKVTIKPQEKPAPVAPLTIHGKSPFFFTKNDERFKDLEDFFLKKEETVNTGGSSGEGVEGAKDEAEVKKNLIEDFAVKRQELKSIVKAKIRNSRRKDEKRTLAIKRAIRKKKRKIYQKSKKF